MYRFMYMRWLIHVGDMTHSFVWHASFLCLAWLIHICEMTHSQVWHDSLICLTRFIHTSYGQLVGLPFHVMMIARGADFLVKTRSKSARRWGKFKRLSSFWPPFLHWRPLNICNCTRILKTQELLFRAYFTITTTCLFAPIHGLLKIRKSIGIRSCFAPVTVKSVGACRHFAFFSYGSRLASFFISPENCVFWGASFELTKNLATLDPNKITKKMFTSPHNQIHSRFWYVFFLFPRKFHSVNQVPPSLVSTLLFSPEPIPLPISFETPLPLLPLWMYIFHLFFLFLLVFFLVLFLFSFFLLWPPPPFSFFFLPFPFESRVFIENWKWVSKGCGSYLIHPDKLLAFPSL